MKRSNGHIAPHCAMQRTIEDYISRFYEPEAARYAKLSADNYAEAREIAAWKEKVAAAWDGVKVLEVNTSQDVSNRSTGELFTTTIKVDANGLADDIDIELVINKVEDGETSFFTKKPLKKVAVDGNVVTFEISDKYKDAGVFRYSYRMYPSNPALPHRQDFAFVRWI